MKKRGDEDMIELRIDIDSKRNRKNRIKEVIEMLGLDVVYWDIFKTVHGWHHYIGITNKLTNIEIVLVQALMGSDYRREAFNMIRVVNGSFSEDDQSWNVLFSKKYRYDPKKDTIKLYSWEVEHEKIRKNEEGILETIESRSDNY